ncbi:MAG: hypothetical protein NTW95_14680 [Candidatus Aminicenantes bacterium]|nr:hypothetical protein [Candidatus Aminicenantes bacterium]
MGEIWRCPKCNASVSVSQAKCGNCGTQKNAVIQPTIGEKSEEDEKKKYGALRTVAGLLSIFAYISILFAIVTALKFVGDEQVLYALVVFFSVFAYSLILLALSNLIHVFIDIEFNTRKTREVMQKKFGME